jgi:hypothetical protein
MIRPDSRARAKALIVPRVVATRNGGLLSSSKGVFDMIPNSSAGSETWSRKKFIHANPAGRPLALPQAKPMKIRPKYGNARLRTAIMGDTSFHLHWPRSAGWTDQQWQGLIRPFASSIGHNHGLFDEI